MSVVWCGVRARMGDMVLRTGARGGHVRDESYGVNLNHGLLHAQVFHSHRSHLLLHLRV